MDTRKDVAAKMESLGHMNIVTIQDREHSDYARTYCRDCDALMYAAIDPAVASFLDVLPEGTCQQVQADNRGNARMNSENLRQPLRDIGGGGW